MYVVDFDVGVQCVRCLTSGSDLADAGFNLDVLSQSLTRLMMLQVLVSRKTLTWSMLLLQHGHNVSCFAVSASSGCLSLVDSVSLPLAACIKMFRKRSA